jgi:hypothetical protein
MGVSGGTESESDGKGANADTRMLVDMGVNNERPNFPRYVYTEKQLELCHLNVPHPAFAFPHNTTSESFPTNHPQGIGRNIPTRR